MSKHMLVLRGSILKSKWFVKIMFYGLCTLYSVQPVLVFKGPWGTRQCLNPNIRSEGFLLLSRINQTFLISHNSAQKDKYFTSIRPNHLLRGSTWKLIVLENKSSCWYLPIRLKKHILIKCLSKTTSYMLFLRGRKWKGD